MPKRFSSVSYKEAALKAVCEHSGLNKHEDAVG